VRRPVSEAECENGGSLLEQRTPRKELRLISLRNQKKSKNMAKKNGSGWQRCMKKNFCEVSTPNGVADLIGVNGERIGVNWTANSLPFCCQKLPQNSSFSCIAAHLHSNGQKARRARI
jgi:hypothetical protein